MTSPILQPDRTISRDVIPAGKWAVQINIGTPTSPVWKFIYRITNFNPKIDIRTEDGTDINDDGWASEVGVGASATIDIEGLVAGEFDSDGDFVQDEGQIALLAASEDFGNEVDIRYWRRDGVPTAKRIQGIPKVTLDGGKPGTTQKFSGSITVNGKPTDIVKPTSAYTVSVGAASAGTFTLTYGGKTTSSLDYNDTASDIKAALVALDDGYGTGDWTVTGTAPTWVITTPGGELTGTGSLTDDTLTITN